MNLNYQEQIPADFHIDSKVWIYQSNRLLQISEAFQLETVLNKFVSEWESHGASVKGYANLFFGQFIVFMADDTDARICGRAIDAVARFVKELEQQFSLNLIDRTTLAFLVKDKVEILPFSQLNYAIENNYITTETLYFNNLVATKKELLNHWVIPVKESWLMSKIKIVKAV
jgi:hypothetical protein